MKGEDLLDRIVSGDQAAFKKLVRKYRHAVFLSALSILHDPDEAEEIAQEVFLKVHLHLSGLRDQNAFERWLRSISCNLAIDRLRERTRRGSCIPLDEVAPEDLLSPSADEELLKREAVEEVMRAIEELPEGEREILREHLLEDKGYRELSEKYGLSYHAVVMRVRRAKEKVREKVLKRLGCVVILPCREIVKLIGGVVMKVSTKVAITGAVMLMLAGAGVWMVKHHGEEKPVLKPSGVKVEQRMEAMVSPQKGTKESDDLTFEEFNAFLDAVLDEFDGQGEEDTAMERVSPPSSSGIAEGEIGGEAEGKQVEQEETVEEIPEELKIVMERIDELVAEAERLMKERLEILAECEELDRLEEHLFNLVVSGKVEYEEERRKIARRRYELAKYGSEVLGDAYQKAWDEIHRLLDMVEEYALRGNPAALEFLREKYNHRYERVLERLKSKERG